MLIVCKDERTASQVAGVLAHGAKAWLADHWARVADGAATAAFMPRSRSAPAFAARSNSTSSKVGVLAQMSLSNQFRLMAVLLPLSCPCLSSHFFKGLASKVGQGQQEEDV